MEKVYGFVGECIPFREEYTDVEKLFFVIYAYLDSPEMDKLLTLLDIDSTLDVNDRIDLFGEFLNKSRFLEYSDVRKAYDGSTS